MEFQKSIVIIDINNANDWLMKKSVIWIIMSQKATLCSYVREFSSKCEKKKIYPIKLFRNQSEYFGMNCLSTKFSF